MFELIKGRNSEDWTWGIRIDGMVFTWLQLPDSRWTNWAGAGQSEIKFVQNTVDGRFHDKVFYHGPGGQQPEALRFPWKELCGGDHNPWPRRPGYQRRYWGPGESLDHYGPTMQAACPP